MHKKLKVQMMAFVRSRLTCYIYLSFLSTRLCYSTYVKVELEFLALDRQSRVELSAML